MIPLVVIPTYNEIENIGQIIDQIFALPTQFHVLVVDDSSPDGTGQFIQKKILNHKNLHLLVREKEGLGKAYLAGFQWALDKNFDAIIEMDADFSHRPVDLQTLFNCLTENEFAVGSRYVKGGRTVNWGILRKIISRGGSLYSRIILGFPLRDWTGGFNAWRAQTLKKIDLKSIRSNGYSFQIELKYRALQAACRYVESPIVFEDRRVGQSKMSMKIVIEAFWQVWRMRFQK